MTSRSFTCLTTLCAALLLGTLVPATSHAGRTGYDAYVRQLLKADLQAIPAGVPATDAQKLALSADLDKLFYFSFPLPTVTIDFLADQLADAVSAGTFAPEDTTALANEVLRILEQSSSAVRPKRLAALRATLAKAQVDPARVERIAAAVTALPSSFGYNSISVSLGADLQVAHPDTPGFKHASGSVSVDQYARPTFNRDGTVLEPVSVEHSFSVQLDRLPLGRYQLSVTTSPAGAAVDLGTFGVRSYPPVTTTAPAGTAPAGTVQASGGRYANVTFGDSGYGKPLPDGLSPDRVTGVTITDAQGVVQFTGGLAASAGALTTRNVDLRLMATAAAPTVGGTIYFVNTDGYNPDRIFTLAAVGLPANARLTLSVDGTAVGPVATGPTGNLYVKEYNSYNFNPPPGVTDVVNLLPDAVDLSAAKTFTLSDAQGNVLASAGL